MITGRQADVRKGNDDRRFSLGGYCACRVPYDSIQRGRICLHGRKINLSHALAGQNVGVTQAGDRLWLVTFMHYDLGYFDDEAGRVEPIADPFGSKVLPMSPE